FLDNSAKVLSASVLAMAPHLPPSSKVSQSIQLQIQSELLLEMSSSPSSSFINNTLPQKRKKRQLKQEEEGDDEERTFWTDLVPGVVGPLPPQVSTYLGVEHECHRFGAMGVGL